MDKYSQVFTVNQQRVSKFKSQFQKMRTQYRDPDINILIDEAVGGKSLSEWDSDDFDHIAEVFNKALSVRKQKKRDLVAVASMKAHERWKQ